MATFDINETHSATYTVTKVKSGYVGKGTIFKGNEDTGIEFIATGKTSQAAVNATMAAARRVCPAE